MSPHTALYKNYNTADLSISNPPMNVDNNSNDDNSQPSTYKP